MSAMEEETVDWGDVETAAGQAVEGASGGDDVISLGGAEELEEEVMGVAEKVPSPTATSTGPAKKSSEETPVELAVDDRNPAVTATEPEKQRKPLPPGWKLQEARSGGTYYFNTHTGETTWDFPSEEDSVRAKDTEEKLGGIQIRGSARGADRKDEGETSRKREATTEEKQQKRRRSNTPEQDVRVDKKETWSPSPPPVKKLDDRSQDRGRVSPRRTDNGWSKRAEGATPTHRRPDESRQSHEAAPLTNNRPREQEYRRQDNDGRDRGYQRAYNGSGNGGSNGHSDARANGYAQQRPGGYQSGRVQDGYDGRRERDRGYERKREASPVRPREEPDRRASSVRADRESVRDNSVRADRESVRDNSVRAERVPTRDNGVRADREPAQNSNVRADREPTRGRDDVGTDRARDRRDRDSDKVQEARTSADPSQVSRTARQDMYPSRAGHGGQGYNYMDRNMGSRQGRPYPPVDPGYDAARPGPGYRPHAVPFSPADGGYGKPVVAPYGPGIRPPRPFVPPEEKQKKWWNKNSGERKPVVETSSAEPEGRRQSSSTPSSVEQPRRVGTDRADRERELSEREAAIARKERELGLK